MVIQMLTALFIWFGCGLIGSLILPIGYLIEDKCLDITIKGILEFLLGCLLGPISLFLIILAMICVWIEDRNGKLFTIKLKNNKT